MTRENDNILRLKEVQKRAPLHRATIYRKMANGTFPQSVPLSATPAGEVTAVGWYETDINAWVADPTGWRPAPEVPAGG
jgi:prophage regulatory protein